jgi:hypothetical protein
MKLTHYHYLIVFLLLNLNFIFAQQSISGVVTDDAGVPLPGVNVVIKMNTKWNYHRL